MRGTVSLYRHHTRCVRTQTGELNVAAVREQEVCVVLGEGFLYKADECSFLHTAGPMCRMCEECASLLFWSPPVISLVCIESHFVI